VPIRAPVSALFSQPAAIATLRAEMKRVDRIADSTTCILLSDIGYDTSASGLARFFSN
jgi:hypothetical protein